MAEAEGLAIRVSLLAQLSETIPLKPFPAQSEELKIRSRRSRCVM
jgi:hypothetical protein